MKVLLAAAGSRGDVQPMLALAVALARRGHAPVLATSPTFAAEAANFGIPFVPMGMDVLAFLASERSRAVSNDPLAFVRLLNSAMATELAAQFEVLPPLALQADLVVAGGVVMAGASAAEAAGIPLRYVGYSPQIFPSAHHLPIMLPDPGLPRWLNLTAWWAMGWVYNRMLLAPFNAGRAALGLPEVDRCVDHLFSPEQRVLATDPELRPAPPDLEIPVIGALCLEDERPLPAEVEDFLAAGPPPVYVGFGSMPDQSPEQTTAAVVEAAERTGTRVLLSAGWAQLGQAMRGAQVQALGPVSHRQLLPRCAAGVHHGGAGTTAAMTRAGIPQLVVPHAFDQLGFGRAVRAAGLGPAPFARKKLDARRLARAFEQLRAPALRQRAAEVGERVRARDASAMLIALLEAAVAGAGARPASNRRSG